MFIHSIYNQNGVELKHEKLLCNGWEKGPENQPDRKPYPPQAEEGFPLCYGSLWVLWPSDQDSSAGTLSVQAKVTRHV